MSFNQLLQALGGRETPKSDFSQRFDVLELEKQGGEKCKNSK